MAKEKFILPKVSEIQRVLLDLVYCHLNLEESPFHTLVHLTLCFIRHVCFYSVILRLSMAFLKSPEEKTACCIMRGMIPSWVTTV